MDASGVSETDLRDLLNRMIAVNDLSKIGCVLTDDPMKRCEIYQLIDEWLMQKGVIPPPPSAPGLN